MKTPKMNTFALPISPSHIATAAGLVLVQLAPGIKPEPKGIITAAVVGAYVVCETIYSSIRAKRPELPESIEQLASQVEALERGK